MPPPSADRPADPPDTPDVDGSTADGSAPDGSAADGSAADGSVQKDGDLAEALRRSGLRPGDLLTHYNHGDGRIVLVPKAGGRVVVRIDGGSTQEEGS